MISAETIENQIPFSPHKIGKIKTAEIWNTKVRRKEIRAEVSPSFKAVKKEEPNMANPENKKEKEKIAKAWAVISRSSASYPTNSVDNGLPDSSPAANIRSEKHPIRIRLFLRRLLNSSKFFAP